MKNKKHIRLTLDFEISIDPSAIPDQRDGETDYYARQKRLLHEILSNKEDLYHILASQIHTQLEANGDEIARDSFLEEDSDIEKILASPIGRLDKADQEYYMEAEKERIFFEQIEGVLDCFSTEHVFSDVSICGCEVQG